MRGIARAALALLLAPGTAQALGSDPGRPMLTRFGPYGDPFELRPAATAATFEMGEVFRPASTAAGRDASPASGAVGAVVIRDPGRPVAPESQGASADSDDLPARPGELKRAPTRIPGFSRGNDVVAPHAMSPDVELPVTQRSSLGMFGKLGRLDVDDRQLPVSTARPHSLGAGVSFEYRFGTK